MKNHRRRINIKLKIVFVEILIMILLIIVVTISKKRYEADKEYTRDNPYIISSTEDFVDFANMVQDGYSFEGEYVLMTNDIDLTDTWVPAMGIPDSGHYFEGTFDGGGHRIYNIYMGVDEGDCSLFGTLGGTVMNLGVEPGVVQGHTCGSIASHSVDENARIINCYNKASLYGGYTGGIAGNFDGKIINCWTMCELYGEIGQGNIICYGNSDVTNCFSIYSQIRNDTHNDTANYVNYFLDENKHTSYSEFIPDICEQLNKGLHLILAVECPDIPVKDYVLWETSDGGQTIVFSDKKASPMVVDYLRGIIYILKEYYPFSGIIFVMLIFVNTLLLTNGVGKIYVIQKLSKKNDILY